MNAKVIFSVIGGLVLIIILLIAQSRDSDVPTASASDPVAVSVDTNKPIEVKELKNESGLTYKIGYDRTSQMTVPGRNFAIAIDSSSTPPTIDQLKKLGEFLRDRYIDEPFLDIAIYDDEASAKVDPMKLDVDDDADYEKLLKVQTHLLATYNRNRGGGVDRLEIFPIGFTYTKYEDIVKVEY